MCMCKNIKKITILSDSHGRGIVEKINSFKENIYYEACAIVKPAARFTEIVKVLSSNTADYKVLICGGSMFII